jgi:hypothetical protein
MGVVAFAAMAIYTLNDFSQRFIGIRVTDIPVTIAVAAATGAIAWFAVHFVAWVVDGFKKR